MRRAQVHRILALLGLVLTCLLGGCATDGPVSPSRDTAPSAPAASRSLATATAPMRADRARWARGNVPRSVPEEDTPLVSLLEDPPGRALVTSYLPRPSTAVEGIDSEAIEFFGVDGRWRRLALADLDLPDDVWLGGDTYGAGALSPDGRWWAGPMIGGMFLVDLSDGGTTVRQVPGAHGHASFEWSPDSDELVLTLFGRSTRAAVPDLRLRPFPRPTVYPRLLADGGWVECPISRHVVNACSTYARDGTLTGTRPTPEGWRSRWAGPTEQLGDSVFYSLATNAYGNRRRDWEVLRASTDFRADARLVLPAGSEINGVDDAFSPKALGLAAIDHRLLLAWLVEKRQVVKVIRPGIGSEPYGMDWWDISFARDLVTLH